MSDLTRMFDLTGRAALVTGAGQNVGAGIARCLAARGATVVVNDYFADRAQAVADQIVAAGGRAAVSAFDVTDLAAVAAAVDALGPVDILVNNAGISATHGMTPKRFRDMTPEEWEQPIRINLYGVMHCTKAVLDGMIERGWGRIITISSGAGTAGVGIGVAPYSAGKGGGVAFTRTLALEVARSGVTANTLALGLMNVRDRDVTERLARTIPVGRTGTPEDVGAACVWLASDEASWVTGQTIGINGGSITT
jgi:NAD(P)-dependent dehydrogenase (short-subunit alcohol dehydrogenase family)